MIDIDSQIKKIEFSLQNEETIAKYKQLYSLQKKKIEFIEIENATNKEENEQLQKNLSQTQKKATEINNLNQKLTEDKEKLIQTNQASKQIIYQLEGEKRELEEQKKQLLYKIRETTESLGISDIPTFENDEAKQLVQEERNKNKVIQFQKEKVEKENQNLLSAIDKLNQTNSKLADDRSKLIQEIKERDMKIDELNQALQNKIQIDPSIIQVSNQPQNQEQNIQQQSSDRQDIQSLKDRLKKLHNNQKPQQNVENAENIENIENVQKVQKVQKVYPVVSQQEQKPKENLIVSQNDPVLKQTVESLQSQVERINEENLQVYGELKKRDQEILELKEENHNLKKENENLKNEEQESNAKNKRIQDLSAVNSKQKLRINNLKKENDKLKKENENLRKANDNLKQENENLKKENDNLKNEEKEPNAENKKVQDLSSDNSKLKKDNSKLKKENDNLKKENDNLKKENDNLKKENDNLKKENDNLKKENDNLKKENENLKNDNLKKENENIKKENPKRTKSLKKPKIFVSKTAKSPVSKNKKDPNEELKNENQNLRKQNQNLQEEIAKKEKEKDELIDNLQQQINQMKKKNNEDEKENSEQIALLNSRIKSLQEFRKKENNNEQDPEFLFNLQQQTENINQQMEDLRVTLEAKTQEIEEAISDLELKEKEIFALKQETQTQKLKIQNLKEQLRKKEEDFQELYNSKTLLSNQHHEEMMNLENKVSELSQQLNNCKLEKTHLELENQQLKFDLSNAKDNFEESSEPNEKLIQEHQQKIHNLENQSQIDKNEIQQKQQQITRLSSSLEKKDALIDEYQTQILSLQQSINSLEQKKGQISLIENEKFYLQKNLDLANNEIDDLKNRQRNIESRIAKIQEEADQDKQENYQKQIYIANLQANLKELKEKNKKIQNKLEKTKNENQNLLAKVQKIENNSEESEQKYANVSSQLQKAISNNKRLISQFKQLNKNKNQEKLIESELNDLKETNNTLNSIIEKMKIQQQESDGLISQLQLKLENSLESIKEKMAENQQKNNQIEFLNTQNEMLQNSLKNESLNDITQLKKILQKLKQKNRRLKNERKQLIQKNNELEYQLKEIDDQLNQEKDSEKKVEIEKPSLQFSPFIKAKTLYSRIQKGVPRLLQKLKKQAQSILELTNELTGGIETDGNSPNSSQEHKIANFEQKLKFLQLTNEQLRDQVLRSSKRMSIQNEKIKKIEPLIFELIDLIDPLIRLKFKNLSDQNQNENQNENQNQNENEDDGNEENLLRCISEAITVIQKRKHPSQEINFIHHLQRMNENEYEYENENENEKLRKNLDLWENWAKSLFLVLKPLTNVTEIGENEMNLFRNMVENVVKFSNSSDNQVVMDLTEKIHLLQIREMMFIFQKTYLMNSYLLFSLMEQDVLESIFQEEFIKTDLVYQIIHKYHQIRDGNASFLLFKGNTKPTAEQVQLLPSVSFTKNDQIKQRIKVYFIFYFFMKKMVQAPLKKQRERKEFSQVNFENEQKSFRNQGFEKIILAPTRIKSQFFKDPKTEEEKRLAELRAKFLQQGLLSEKEKLERLKKSFLKRENDLIKENQRKEQEHKQKMLRLNQSLTELEGELNEIYQNYRFPKKII